jgi:hypothetical protein
MFTTTSFVFLFKNESSRVWRYYGSTVRSLRQQFVCFHGPFAVWVHFIFVHNTLDVLFQFEDSCLELWYVRSLIMILFDFVQESATNRRSRESVNEEGWMRGGRNHCRSAHLPDKVFGSKFDASFQSNYGVFFSSLVHDSCLSLLLLLWMWMSIY